MVIPLPIPHVHHENSSSSHDFLESGMYFTISGFLWGCCSWHFHVLVRRVSLSNMANPGLGPGSLSLSLSLGPEISVETSVLLCSIFSPPAMTVYSVRLRTELMDTDHWWGLPLILPWWRYLNSWSFHFHGSQTLAPLESLDSLVLQKYWASLHVWLSRSRERPEYLYFWGVPKWCRWWQSCGPSSLY